MSKERIVDFTENAHSFPDMESGKVKIIVLDGNGGKVKVLNLPEHGDTIIQTAKGKCHKVKFVDEHLL